MLRELIDLAFQEDFVHGLSRASGLRVCTYDEQRFLIVASRPVNAFSRFTGRVLGVVPANAPLTRVAAHDPPGSVAFIEDRGVWYVAAPIFVDDRQAGWLAVGEFRADEPPRLDWADLAVASRTSADMLTSAWQRLPILERESTSHPVVTARWGARVLAGWSRRESRLAAATEEAALVGDIAELLTGREELQAILDRVVMDTARVMRCRFCSLRLYDGETDELRVQAVYNLSEQYVTKGIVRRSDNPIDDEALRGRVVYVEDVGTDNRVQFPVDMRREGIVSQLTAGMLYHGQPVGVLRVYTDRRQRFRATQRNLLRAVAHQAAMAIVHARLIEQRLRSAETERQLTLASQLQARMMRIPAPDCAGLELATAYHPSSALGGDFCDTFQLRDGRVACVVADVVGKGIPASLLSASIRGALAAHADAESDLGRLIARLNRQVVIETAPAEFATMLIVAFDPESCAVGYCAAGHEPPLLRRDGVVRRLEEGDAVIGLHAAEQYVERGLATQPGDLIVLATDGVSEAMNFAGELFGRERLRQAVELYGDLPLPQVLKNIVWDVRRFAGLAEQSDDLTLVALRVNDVGKWESGKVGR